MITLFQRNFDQLCIHTHLDRVKVGKSVLQSNVTRSEMGKHDTNQKDVLLLHLHAMLCVSGV